jgi:hypothetical protein
VYPELVEAPWKQLFRDIAGQWGDPAGPSVAVYDSAPINPEEAVVELMWADIKNHLGALSQHCEGRSPAQVVRIPRVRADGTVIRNPKKMSNSCEKQYG